MPARGRLTSASPTSFNPRPPLLAGDAWVAQKLNPAIEVSIRARHCWRAMHSAKRRYEPRRTFQSAPAIAGGRCLRLKTYVQESIVSIRARHCWRAMPLDLGAIRQRQHVSIRARHCWRAMPNKQCHSSPPSTRFNPRPPLLAGDAAGVGPRAVGVRVSIRARHCWRAMPGRREPVGHAHRVSIRARHCWRAMRDEPNLPERDVQFQSAPAIAGGRCDAGRHRGRDHRCFNPRPPLLAGDA